MVRGVGGRAMLAQASAASRAPRLRLRATIDHLLSGGGSLWWQHFIAYYHANPFREVARVES